MRVGTAFERIAGQVEEAWHIRKGIVVAVDVDSRECGEGVRVGEVERFGWEGVILLAFGRCGRVLQTWR